MLKILVVNLPVVFPGYWAMAFLIVQCGTDGLASRTVPCVSLKDLPENKAFKTKKMNFLHDKSKTGIVCWNVCTLRTLGEQSAYLLCAI